MLSHVERCLVEGSLRFQATISLLLAVAWIVDLVEVAYLNQILVFTAAQRLLIISVQ